MDNNVKANESEDKTLLTLEQRLSEPHSVHFFHGNDALNRMCERIWVFMNQVDEEIFWYVSFCLAKEGEKSPFWLPSLGMLPTEERDLYRPLWGFQASDAMVLLGLMLLDHARGGMKDGDIYHCMRMTLGKYLDALADISFQEDGMLEQRRVESFRNCRDTLLKDYDGSRSLGEVLADILRHYATAWREFDRLNHILSCMEELSSHLEWEAFPPELGGVEIVEEYTDPRGYYFNLACRYPEDAPEPGSEDIAKEGYNDGFFLPERDYHPDSLRKLAAQAPSLEMRALLEEHICEERLASAMREINKAVTDLFLLFVNPYLQLWKS